MSEIRVDINKSNQAASEEAKVAKSLMSYSNEVASIRSNMRYKIAAREQISAKLRETADQLRRKSTSTDAMRQALEQILALYRQTEEKNLPLLREKATKVKDGTITGTLEKIRDFIDKIRRGLGLLPGGAGNGTSEYAGEPVDMCTGSYVNEITDLVLRGAMDLDFVRCYNSRYPQKGTLGIGWTHNYETRIETDENTVTVLWGDGRQESFSEDGSGVFQSDFGSYDSLSRTENGFCYRNKTGDQYFFDQNGRLVSIGDRYSHTITFEYEGDVLTSVRASEKRWLRFEYEGGLLSKVNDSIGRSVRFFYEDGLLSSVEAADGSTESYEYDDGLRLSALINAESVRILENTYDAEGRVASQHFPDSTEMRYEYGEDHLKFTDRNGVSAVYYHDDHYRHVRTVFEAGEESYVYNEKNERILYKDLNGGEWHRSFDDRGNVISLTDPAGGVTSYDYDDRNLLTCIREADGTVTKFSYDEDGSLAEISDGLGNTQLLKYHGGMLSEVTDADGVRESWTYDDDGHLLSVKDGLGNETLYAYDDAGRMISCTDRNGNVSDFAYDGKDRLTLIRNPLGEEKQFIYNLTGKTAIIKDFDDKTEHWNYSIMGDTSEYYDKAGAVTRYVQDKMSNLSEIHSPDGSVIYRTFNGMNLLETVEQEGQHPRHFTYDSYGRIVSERLGEEERTYTYDAVGRLISQRDWSGSTVSMKRDAAGNVMKRIEADGTKVYFAYDAAGRCISEKTDEGIRAEYQYSPAGRITALKDASGRETRYTYDGRGMLSRVTYADGTWKEYRYDREQNLTELIMSSGYTEFYSYDALNRRTEVKDSEGRTRKLIWNAAGQVEETINAAGKSVHYKYDDNGNLVKLTDECGQITRYAYDPMGRMTAILKNSCSDEKAGEILADPQAFQTPENRAIHLMTWKRDPQGHITECTNAVGDTESFEYDSYGRLSVYKDQEGNVRNYHYSAGGLLSDVGDAEGPVISMTYDSGNRISSVKNINGTSSFRYNTAGYLLHAEDCFGHRTDYSFHPSGDPEAIRTGDTVRNYEYDPLYRLAGISLGGGKVSYSYDADGRLSEKKMGGGLSEKYLYTPAGQTAGLVLSDAEGEFYSCEYSYDCFGNISVKKEKGKKNGTKTTELKYDALQRLTEVSENGEITECYRYDEFSNCVESTIRGVTAKMLYNVLNQLMEKSSDDGTFCRYEYDARGNLISETKNGKTRKYQYNTSNRLQYVEEDGVRKAEYLWDGLGHCIGKMADGVRTSFVADLNRQNRNVLSVENSSGRIDYLSDELPFMAAENGERTWFLADERGSIIAAADDQGRLKDFFMYDSFGNSRENSVERTEGPGYTGLLWDPDAKAYYAQSRWYAPEQMRFLEKDKEQYIRAEMPESINLYAYCRNNPVIFIDPDGTDCYIFYLPEWKNEAIADQKALAQKYGYDISKVHIVPVTSAQELTNGWNGMGTVNGQQVDIDTVVINSHANPYSLSFGNGNKMTQQNIQNLNNQNVKELVLYGCNAGHMDYSQTNPAAQFAQRVNGAQVLASDGTVYSNSGSEKPHTYTGKPDEHFKGYLRNGDRDNVGWVEYRYENGRVTTNVVGKKQLYLREMTDYLRRRRGTMC